MNHPDLTAEGGGNSARLSAFILTGRKEKAGNSSESESFHRAHCFNVGEGDTSSSNTTCWHQCVYSVYLYWGLAWGSKELVRSLTVRSLTVFRGPHDNR